MMRKFNKKKAAKRGAILVTVVFVLAFATIFIAAAMMLTQATRKRVYTEAESDQARLTVTSVAEAWYRAVVKCEYSDDAILQLCKANTGHGTQVRVKASSSADAFPGLDTIGQPESSTSYTTASFYRSPNKNPATKDEDYTYVADFSTRIENQVENVRISLTYTPPANPSGGKPFSTQIDFNGKFGQNNLKLVGDGKSDDLDNIFLVRKGGKNENSGFSTVATMVYCDGDVAFKADNIQSKDIVFLAGARIKKLDDSTFYTGKVENLFFFGTPGINEKISDGDYVQFSNLNKGDVTFYLCNRTKTSITGNADVIYVDENGDRTETGATPLSPTMKTKIQKYAQYNKSYKKGGTEEFPTTDSFLASMKSNIRVGKTAPGSYTYKNSMGKFLKDYCYQRTNATLPSGTYIFDDDGCDPAANSNKHPKVTKVDKEGKPTDEEYNFHEREPYIIVLNGNNTYRFWFKGGKTFNPRFVVFVMYNTDPGNPALFCLEDKAKIYWPGKNGDTDSDGTAICNNGILSVNRNLTSAKAAFDYVYDIYEKLKEGPSNFENTANKGYSVNYDGTKEPCAMIIGMGHNTVKFDKNIILEAFLGLFNDSYDTDSQSKLIFRNGDAGVFYGRMMTDGYDDADGGSILNPAAPGSSSFNGSKPPIQKAVTNFALKSMIYYYNLGNNKSGS